MAFWIWTKIHYQSLVLLQKSSKSIKVFYFKCGCSRWSICIQHTFNLSHPHPNQCHCIQVTVVIKTSFEIKLGLKSDQETRRLNKCSIVVPIMYYLSVIHARFKFDKASLSLKLEFCEISHPRLFVIEITSSAHLSHSTKTLLLQASHWIVRNHGS